MSKQDLSIKREVQGMWVQYTHHWAEGGGKIAATCMQDKTKGDTKKTQFDDKSLTY